MADLDTEFARASRASLVPPGMHSGAGAGIIKNDIPKMAQSIANVADTIMWGLSSPHSQHNIQETIKRSVIRKFVPYVNTVAITSPRKFAHLYEWNRVGRTTARLFDPVVTKGGRGKASFSVEMMFRPSRTLVPLTKEQKRPGPSGRVVKRRYKFYNKAKVMEFGETVTIQPKSAKFMAYSSGGLGTNLSGLAFRKKPIVFNFKHSPGYGEFSKVTADYFTRVAPGITDVSLKKYAAKVSRRANASSVLLNVSVPSDTQAKMIAQKMTSSLGPVEV